MKHGKFYLTLLSIGILSGCGHGVLITNKLTGLSVTVPVYDGQRLGVTIGSLESTTATVRGGTTVETKSVSGGGLLSGAGGINHLTTMKTNTQLNEGYLTEVLTSPECPESVKTILASNLATAAQAPQSQPEVIQTAQSTVHSGESAVTSNNVQQITTPTGVDKIIDGVVSITSNTTSSVTEIVGDITGGVTSLTTNLVDTVSTSSTSLLDRFGKWWHDLKWSNFWMTILVTVTGFLAYRFLSGSDSAKERPMPQMKDINPDTLTPNAPQPPPDDPGPPPQPEPKKEEEEEDPNSTGFRKKLKEKEPWWKRLWLVVCFIWGWISRIPPEKRKELLNRIRGFIIKKK